MAMREKLDATGIVYVALIGLTCLSFVIGEYVPLPFVVAVTVVAIGVLKGMLIENWFLGLKTNMNPTRLVFDLWLVCCGVIAIVGCAVASGV